MAARPFFHKYETAGRRYVYDVSSNVIFSVGEREYAMVDAFNRISPDQMLDQFGSVYGEAAVKDTWAGMLAAAPDDSMLSGKRPEGLGPIVCADHIDEQLQQLAHLIYCASEQCNLRCKYCTYSGNYVNERRHDNRYMSTETALGALRVFLDHSGKSERITISFYGGEPLLNIEIIREVIRAAEREIPAERRSFRVDTNGVLLDRETVQYFRDHEVTIQVSVDGPREIHDRYRTFANDRPSFDKVMAGLKNIREIDRDYYASHVVIMVTVAPPYDLASIDEYFDSQKQQPLLLKAGLVNIDGCDYESIFAESLAEIDPAAVMDHYQEAYALEKCKSGDPVRSRTMLDIFDPPMIRIHRRELGPVRAREHPNGICIPGQRRLFVSTDGEFHLCEKMGGRQPMIGSVATGLDSAAIQRTMDEYISGSEGDCKDCWAVRLCGMCYIAAWGENGFEIERKRHRCEMERRHLHESLVLYSTIMEQNPRAYDYVANMVIS